MNEIERRFRLIIISVVIVIIGAVVISLISKNNDSQNSGLAVRELKADVKIVDKEFKDYTVEDALSNKDKDVEGNIDLLSFQAVDAGITKDILYVDFIVHELGKEDTLEFVVGYEKLLKEELKSDIPPVQFRLFSSEQHYKEEIPKYVYIDDMLYIQEDKEVENVIEEMEEFEDPYSIQIEEDNN